MIIHEIRDPFEENAKKMYEILEQRKEKGEDFTVEEMVTTIYHPISLPPKGYRIVDCEPEKLMKFVSDYRGLLNAEILPVQTQEEWKQI